MERIQKLKLLVVKTFLDIYVKNYVKMETRFIFYERKPDNERELS